MKNIIPGTSEIRKPTYYKNKFKRYNLKNEYDKQTPKQIINKIITFQNQTV